MINRKYNSTNICIRPITESDASETSDIIIQAQSIYLANIPTEKKNEILARYTPEQLIKNSKDINYFIAILNNKIVGVAGIKGNQLRTYSVHPGYQRKGIGRLLFNKIEKEARANNVKKILTRSRLEATGFYKKLGFKQLKSECKIYQKKEYCEWIMEKNIK